VRSSLVGAPLIWHPTTHPYFVFFFQGCRGLTFNLGIYDEAGYTREGLRVVLPITADAKSKLICTTSATTKEQQSCFLDGLRHLPNFPLYVVSLSCDRHLRDVARYDKATACPCFYMATPPARTATQDLKAVMETLFPDSFIQEVVGGGTNPSSVMASTMSRPFANTENFAYNSRLDTLSAAVVVGDTLVAYVDPAYSDSACASATGIAACAAVGTTIALLGLERVEQTSDMGRLNQNIAAVCASILVRVVLAHGNFTKCLVVIERNMASSAGHTIARAVNELFHAYLGSQVELVFLHHKGCGKGPVRVGYILGAEKSGIVADMGDLFAADTLVASTSVQSSTLTDPVRELCDELSGVTRKTDGSYTGKTKPGNRDDLAISFLMSCYFVLRRNSVGDLALPL